MDSIEKILPHLNIEEKLEALNKLIGFYSRVNADVAFKYSEDALFLARKINNVRLLGVTFYNTANIYLYQGKYEPALQKYDSAKVYAELSGDMTQLADIYNSYGYLYAEKGDYVKALENYIYSYKISEKVKHYKGIANSTNNIGIIYAEQNRFDMALEYFNKPT